MITEEDYFIASLKNGQRFSTRFQENSWGIYYDSEKMCFLYWSETLSYELSPPDFVMEEREMSEQEVRILTRGYTNLNI